MRVHLAKYFTIEKIADAANIELTLSECRKIQSICAKDELKFRDIVSVCQLIKARITADYTLHDELGELKAFLSADPDITVIKLVGAATGQQFPIKNKTIIKNILHFLNPALRDYINGNHIPREKRKIKGTLPDPQQRYNRRLAAHIINYFRAETPLTRDTIIKIVFDLFLLMNNPLLERTGELCNPTINLYDTITRTTRKAK